MSDITQRKRRVRLYCQGKLHQREENYTRRVRFKGMEKDHCPSKVERETQKQVLLVE